MTDRPPKIFKPANGSLFDILHTDILATIDNYLVGIEYHDTLKHVLWQIKYREIMLFTHSSYCTGLRITIFHPSDSIALPATSGYSEMK